jgi:YD repeat-containing protein
MKYKFYGKEYELKSWYFILIILIAIYIIGCIFSRNDANSIKTINQRDRIETYYYDENGNISRRETNYKDGRPTEIKEY